LSLRKAFGAGCIFWDTPGTNMAPGSPARFRGVRLGLALALLAAALAPVSRAVPDEPAWQVYFSPNHGATKAVVDALDGAKSTVLVQAYSFTSAPIAKALVQAHDRGVDVQVILDRKETGSKYSSADFVAHAGISTLIDGKHAIAHNKVMIIDGVAVITGSFNFTTAAERQNAENLLVIHDRALAARYTENWRDHAAHSTHYAGR
jgi:phosphatidylserine/phosphatidylglycerophosphate/cardiolipin synthase-like enzyme